MPLLPSIFLPGGSPTPSPPSLLNKHPHLSLAIKSQDQLQGHKVANNSALTGTGDSTPGNWYQGPRRVAVVRGKVLWQSVKITGICILTAMTNVGKSTWFAEL